MSNLTASSADFFDLSTLLATISSWVNGNLEITCNTIYNTFSTIILDYFDSIIYYPASLHTVAGGLRLSRLEARTHFDTHR